MTDINQKAQRDLPYLRESVEHLLELTSDMLKKVRYAEEDHFGFMALCFLSKQVDHMRSIQMLNESRDVILIVRSMLEGMSQILWAAHDPDNRGKQWRAYSLVHDWRLMHAKIEAGEVVDPTELAEIENRLQLDGGQFYTKKARAALSEGTVLPDDPYLKSWTGLKAKEILEKVNGQILNVKLYKPFSEWHHWSPGGIGQAITRHEQGFSFTPSSPADTATGLAAGFQCLL